MNVIVDASAAEDTLSDRLLGHYPVDSGSYLVAESEANFASSCI